MNDPTHERKLDRIDFEPRHVPSTRDFYERVFGWTFTELGPAYTSFRDGRLAGGLPSAKAMAECGPLVVIYTRDLEALKARLVASGGKVVKDIFAIPGGRRFHFADPGGNVLAVWSDR